MACKEESGLYGCCWFSPCGDLRAAYNALGNRDSSGNKKFYFDQFKSYISSSNDNAKAVAGLLNPNYWAHLKRGDAVYGEEVIGSPTLELWAKAWNAKGPTTTRVTTSADSHGYSVNGQTWVMLNDTLCRNALFFPNKQVKDSSYGYWLASPSASSSYGAYPQLNTIEYQGKIWLEDCTVGTYSLRPVVYLPPSVKLTKSGSSYNLN